MWLCSKKINKKFQNSDNPDKSCFQASSHILFHFFLNSVLRWFLIQQWGKDVSFPRGWGEQGTQEWQQEVWLPCLSVCPRWKPRLSPGNSSLSQKGSGITDGTELKENGMSLGIQAREEMGIQTPACDASVPLFGRKISLVPVALLPTCSKMQVCFLASFGKVFQMCQLWSAQIPTQAAGMSIISGHMNSDF